MTKYVKHKQLLLQACSFFCISGIGWIIDFSIFVCLTSYLNLPVGHANMISSLPAITYVFLVSTKKTFKKRDSNIKLSQKYAIYVLYQFILVSFISMTGEILYQWLGQIQAIMCILFLAEHLKILVKIMITPITMTINFIVMKFLIEKL